MDRRPRRSWSSPVQRRQPALRSTVTSTDPLITASRVGEQHRSHDEGDDGGRDPWPRVELVATEDRRIRRDGAADPARTTPAEPRQERQPDRERAQHDRPPAPPVRSGTQQDPAGNGQRIVKIPNVKSPATLSRATEPTTICAVTFFAVLRPVMAPRHQGCGRPIASGGRTGLHGRRSSSTMLLVDCP